LSKTSQLDAMCELIKNAIEHGNQKIDISIPNKFGEPIIIFNSLSPTQLKKITFSQIMQKLTSFEEQSETNFHEGLTTLLLFKARIEVKDIFIENRASGDNYFQYIESASHFVDESSPDKIEHTLVKVNSIPGWRVILYNSTPEMIESMKFALETFYFRPSWNIVIFVNNQRYEPKLFTIYPLTKSIHLKGILSYTLTPDSDKEQKIQLYWQLKNANCFHLIQNQEFNHQGVTGAILLTSIQQFANENRHELNQEVKSFFSEEIRRLSLNAAESKQLQDELTKYEIYKEKYQDLLSYRLHVAKSQIMRLIDENNQVQTLITLARFTLTLQRLFSTFKELEFLLPKLFVHPSIPIEILSPAEFMITLEKIDLSLPKFRRYFPIIPLGLRILNGEPEGFLVTNDVNDLLTTYSHLQIIDSKVPFSNLIHFDSEWLLIYPTNPYLEYFIADVPYQYIKSNKDLLKEPLITIEQLEDHSEFQIIKGTPKLITKIMNQNSYTTSFGINISNNISSTQERSRLIANYSVQTVNISSISVPFLIKTSITASIDVHLSFLEELQIKQPYLGDYYRIISQIISIIIQAHPEFPSKRLFLFFFHEPRGAKGWYMKKTGVLAINTAYLQKCDHPQELAWFFILLIAHELAHEFIAGHGQKHEQKFEQILSLLTKANTSSKILLLDKIVGLCTLK
jgi:hypothetical protein